MLSCMRVASPAVGVFHAHHGKIGIKKTSVLDHRTLVSVNGVMKLGIEKPPAGMVGGLVIKVIVPMRHNSVRLIGFYCLA